MILNYLVHPRAVVGGSVERLDDAMQVGASLDWDALDSFKLYGNPYHTENRGNGLDLQGIYTYADGNVVLSHNRSWMYTYDYDYDDRLPSFISGRYRSQVRRSEQSSLNLQHRLDRNNSVSARLSQSAGAVSGTGLDLSWMRRMRYQGNDATWRLSVFDRPGSSSSGNDRSRGVDLSLTMSLGRDGRQVYGSLGSRTRRDGGRETAGSLSYQQPVELGALQRVTGTLNSDSYGVGVGATADFDGSLAVGSAFFQTSSYTGDLGAGLNLNSTLAFGEGPTAISGHMAGYEAGMVVEVDSDLPDIRVTAYDELGHSALLQPGRNVIPVTPYKIGNVRFDFRSDEPHSAVIHPQTVGYHLNKGGVAYQQLRIMQTLTVVGRLVDQHGKPLRGAVIANHASRTVSEADGFFAVEMSRSTPLLEVARQGTGLCRLQLDPAQYQQDKEVLLVGDQICTSETVAADASPSAPEV